VDQHPGRDITNYADDPLPQKGKNGSLLGAQKNKGIDHRGKGRGDTEKSREKGAFTSD